MEVHDGADVALAVLAQFLFVEGFADNGQHRAVATGRRLHHVGNETLAGSLVEVLHGLAGAFLVAAQVIIGAVGDTHELLHAEGELVLQVVGLLGVEGALFIRHVEDVNLIAGDTDVLVELEALLQPFVGQAEAVLALAEVFHLHLLELAGAEGEVARVDFVAERLTNLGDAEGNLVAGRIEDVLVLAEDALGRLRTQPAGAGGVILIGGGTDGGLEHQVEGAGLRHQGAIGGVVAHGVGHLLGAFLDELQVSRLGTLAGNLAVVLQGTLAGKFEALLIGAFHQHGEFLLRAPGAILAGSALPPVGHAALGGNLVGAQAFLGEQAVAQRVAETTHVTGCHQHRVVCEDGTIHTHDIGAFLHVDTPPVILQIALELNTQGTVVPATVQATIDFSGLKNEPSALAKADDFFHADGISLCTVCHNAGYSTIKPRICKPKSITQHCGPQARNSDQPPAGFRPIGFHSSARRNFTVRRSGGQCKCD